MVYQVLVFDKGVQKDTFEGIEAPDPLSAIARVEAKYPKFTYTSVENGKVIEVVYTGLCFEARRLERRIA